MANKTNILLVDDRRENLLALEATLETPGITILTAASGNEALGLMLEYDLALVILDVQMPDMDGFEVAELMRKNEKTKYTPIIFVTAFSKDENYIFKGYETGAVDYLFKPLDPVILKSKVNAFLELDRIRKELEVSKEKIEKQNERLKELSITDGLTGLYNHRYFQEILGREFALVQRNRSDLTCFMIDLDFFKDINDTFGHSFGDFVLRRFSQLLKTAIRKTDILARCGGEEFVILLPHTPLEGALVLAEKFRKNAEDCIYQNDGYSRQVTVSVGVSSFRAHHPPTSADLLSFADQALYRAKAEGRNQVRIYNEEAIFDSMSLKPPPTNPLLDLKKKLKKIVEKITEITMTSLETLIPQAQQEQDPIYSHELLRRNKQTTEIFDRMSERLELPRILQQTLKRASRLNNLLKFLWEDKTVPYTGITEKEVEEDPFVLEELTYMFDIFSDERTILRSYREHFDGTGSPEGLQGSEIPLAARIFSLVEAFITMTSPGKNQDLLSPEQAIDDLLKQSGSRFDPFLVGHLLDLVEEKKVLPVPKKHTRTVKERAVKNIKRNTDNG